MRVVPLLLLLMLTAPGALSSSQTGSAPGAPGAMGPAAPGAQLPPAPPQRARVEALAPLPAPARDELNYSDVLLLVNNQSSISTELGRYFKERRGVPDGNVCSISMPTTETISASQFSAIRAEVERFIIDRGLNDSLNYIVTTKGVPHRVSGAAEYYASFDDEISLILGPYAGYIGGNYWLTNPFFGSEERFSRGTAGAFITTRLIGYDLADCMRLVDNAVNSTGARGRFILDMNPNKDGGGYQAGNDWCREANRTLTARGYNVILESTSYYVQNQRDVAGYASWGSNDGNAPNHAITNFTWVPGAVGTTYVSTSARSFSYPPSYGQSLIADNIREGITGIHGNVYEPYLTACARPHILLDRYTRGWNLAEAFSASMATSSWQNCIVGDPKIRPYADNPDPALADGASVEPGTVVEGVVANVSAVVSNLGGSAALNTTLSFYLGNPASGGTPLCPDVTIERLEAGGRARVVVQWSTAGLAGARAIYVRLSPSRERPQLWEGNDQAVLDVMVYGRPDIALRPESLSASDLQPIEGSEVRVELVVANTGELELGTTLELLTDGSLESSRPINLTGGSSSRESFLWSSRGRPGRHMLTIRALPVELEADRGNNELSLELFVRLFGFELRAEAPEMERSPGEVAVFNLTLEATSNAPESVALRVRDVPPVWDLSVEPELVTLEPGGALSWRVSVSVPPFALVTDECSPVASAEGLTSGFRRELGLSLRVGALHRLRVDLDSRTGSAPPGGEAVFDVTVVNLGNGPETARLRCEAREGWGAELSDDSLDISHGGSASVRLSVRPGTGSLAGELGEVRVAAMAGDGSETSASVEVEVERVTGVEASISPPVLALRAGESARATVLINNTGNAPEVVSLRTAPSGISAEAQPESLELQPFSAGAIALCISAPINSGETQVSLSISVAGESGATARLCLEVRVLRPDLVVPQDALAIDPASPVEGMVVNVTVRVRNTGPAPSGRVTVGLHEGGALIDSGNIPDIAAGGEVSLILRWSGAAGPHELVLSASSAFRDLNPEDNSARLAFTVSPEPARPARPSSAGPGWLAAAAGSAGAALAFLVIAALMLRRARGAR
ncbi:MAG: TIGR03790 family protein [Thermoplasmatota archaeon]